MMQQKSMSTRAWAEMALLALIWGASFLSNRIAVTEVPVLTAVLFRVAGACVVLWVYVLWQGYELPKGWRIWGSFLLMGLLGNALPFTLISWGQLTVDSGLAGILNASTAIFGVVFAAMIFRDERLTTRKVVGVCIGFLGVATAIGLQALTSFDLTSLSQLAIIGATVSYAVGGVLGRLMLGGLRPQVAAAGMLTGSSVIMIPLAVGLNGLPSFQYDLQVWGALGYLAIVSTAIAYLLFYRLMGMIGAGNVSLTTLLVAPIAIILGAVVFDEALPLRAYAGFGLLALGLVILDGRLFRRHWSATPV